MRPTRSLAACLLALPVLLPARPAAAADDDQQRIPQAVLDEQPAIPAAAEAPRASRSVFLEANAERVSRRPLLVPIASPDRRRDVVRLIADGRADWALGSRWSAKASARAALADTRDAGHHRDGTIDLREAAVQWQAGERDVAEFGRVNMRQGVALGFNPTDFFRTRTTVDTSTRDPQEQRVNRLGTVMLDAQHVGDAGSLLVAVAPRLAQPASLAREEPQQRLRLGDTNGETRWLVKGQLPLSPRWRPELLAFRDRHGWRIGANATQAFGDQVIGYVEYAGGRRPPVLARALADGIAAGDLPASAAGAFALAPRRWLNDLAVGATWTGASRLSLTLEFDYQQGGPDRAEWDRWFALGSGSVAGAQLAGYLRGAANAQLDPLFRRNLFLRADWPQAGLRDLSLSGFVSRNLDDASLLAQFALEYRLGQDSRLRAVVLFTRGQGNSLFGSDPARHALVVGYVHYL